MYPTKDGIIAKTLFYQNEIQAIPVAAIKPEVTKQELDMAKTMIDTMTTTFDPSLYHDDYQENFEMLSKLR